MEVQGSKQAGRPKLTSGLGGPREPGKLNADDEPQQIRALSNLRVFRRRKNL